MKRKLMKNLRELYRDHLGEIEINKEGNYQHNEAMHRANIAAYCLIPNHVRNKVDPKKVELWMNKKK